MVPLAISASSPPSVFSLAISSPSRAIWMAMLLGPSDRHVWSASRSSFSSSGSLRCCLICAPDSSTMDCGTCTSSLAVSILLALPRLGTISQRFFFLRGSACSPQDPTSSDSSSVFVSPAQDCSRFRSSSFTYSTTAQEYRPDFTG